MTEIQLQHDTGKKNILILFRLFQKQDLFRPGVAKLVLKFCLQTEPVLEMTLGEFTEYRREMENNAVLINNEKMIIKQFGLFDLAALNTIVGKQNHSASEITLILKNTNTKITHLKIVNQ